MATISTLQQLNSPKQNLIMRNAGEYARIEGNNSLNAEKPQLIAVIFHVRFSRQASNGSSRP